MQYKFKDSILRTMERILIYMHLQKSLEKHIEKLHRFISRILRWLLNELYYDVIAYNHQKSRFSFQ